MAFPLLLIGALGAGAVAAKVVGDETQQTIAQFDRSAPNLALIAAIVVTGLAIWTVSKGRR